MRIADGERLTRDGLGGAQEVRQLRTADHGDAGARVAGGFRSGVGPVA
jgi:hypothetical protein